MSPPRFSHGYFPLRNRFGILVETHSWKEYPVRVRITRNLVVGMLEQAARHGRDWLDAAAAADARAATLGGMDVPLDWKATDRVRTVDFRGYAWTRTHSDVSGALATRYDIAYSRLGAGPERSMELEVFRADKVDFGRQPTEGRQRLAVEGDWRPERREVRAGDLFVPIAQARSRVAMALLEPRAPDSLLQWGTFNNAFERKEYMEPYVAEAVARGMLRDPEVRAAFEERLARDPAFAADPAARLDWFYRRHASWDERYALYPVFRSATVPR